MPYYVKCVDEDTWLTEPRLPSTWRALELLAKQLIENSNLIILPEKRKIYSLEEVKTWTDFFFKMRDYKPVSKLDLSAFHVGFGIIDFRRLAAALGVKTEEAVILVKSLDKPLMMAAAEEMLQAVRHSYQFKHWVELVKRRI